MTLVSILNGIFLTTLHIIIALSVGVNIVSNNGMKATMGSLIIILVLYAMSWVYNDCVLTKWESQLLPFVTVDFIGIWIPKYDFSNKSRSLIGQSAILIGLIAILIKIIRYFSIDFYYNYTENKKSNAEYAAIRRKNNRNTTTL